jgi:hypothetical protein
MRRIIGLAVVATALVLTSAPLARAQFTYVGPGVGVTTYGYGMPFSYGYSAPYYGAYGIGPGVALGGTTYYGSGYSGYLGPGTTFYSSGYYGVPGASVSVGVPGFAYRYYGVRPLGFYRYRPRVFWGW